MPQRRAHHCKLCERHRRDAGYISARGKCRYCAERRQLENTHDLRAHDGPWFEWWRRRSLAALGVFLPAPEPPPETPADTTRLREALDDLDASPEDLLRVLVDGRLLDR